MITLAERAGRLMMPKHHLSSLVRDKALSGLLRLPGVRGWVRAAKMRPRPAFKQGLLLTTRARGSAAA